MRLILFLLYGYFLVFGLGQLSRFHLQVPEINLYFSDLLVAAVVFAWLAYHLWHRRKFVLPTLLNQILLFFLIATLSLTLNSSFGFRKENLLSGREMEVAWLYLIRWFFYAALYLVAYELQTKFKNSRLSLSLVTAGLILTILGLAQYFFLPDTRFLADYGWDPHYYRLISTFLDPGYTGIVLVLLLLWLADNFFKSRNSKGRTVLLLIGLVVYLALALTYSRASYLAYLLGLGGLAYFYRQPKFLVTAVFIFIVTIFLLPRPGGEGVRLERESTVRFRIINWSQSLSIAKDHWLWGVGFNAYRYSQRDYGFLEFANWRASHAGGGADSSLLFVLATTGIFGLAAYLWLWGKMFWLSYRGGNYLLVASIIALLAHSFFVNSLFYPWIMGWFWTLAGLTEVKD